MALEKEDDELSARFVKGRLERTTLGQVSRSVRVVLAQGHAHVEVALDKKVIDELQVGWLCCAVVEGRAGPGPCQHCRLTSPSRRRPPPQLEIDVSDVRRALLAAPKLKIKAEAIR